MTWRLAALHAVVAVACATPSLGSEHDLSSQRHHAYEDARTKARQWLDALEVDAVVLNEHGVKGQKKLAEIMDIYLFLERTSEPLARTSIQHRVVRLAAQTDDTDYHDYMQTCSERAFSQNSMSYLRVMWLMREFGLDTARYELGVRAVKPRMDAHLAKRGAWQRAMFAQYYDRFGMRKPAAIRGATMRAGVIRRRAPLEDYDRRTTYRLTHEVFVAFDYGYAKQTSAFNEKDVQYLRSTLPELLNRALDARDTDLAGELVSAMLSLGWRAHASVERAVDDLLRLQNHNGSWGRYEAARTRYGDYVEQALYLHTTGAALRALVAYFGEG